MRCLRRNSFGAVAALILSSLGSRLESDETHWSFVPPARVQVPAPADRAWSNSPIDAFVLDRLESIGLPPSPAEDRLRLIRRVTLDLTGLPPSPRQVSDFLTDTSPDAYEQLVDRLLASPAYGERWAQHWLDVVRYADSDGFEYDDPRPSAWRYRDWVIAAFDADKPYDQFIIEQIAGDELSPNDVQRHIPTGLHRLGPLRKNAGNQDLEKNRQELLVQMTDAIGFSFLGLTIGCAKCHDHKFDPILQEEYYSLQAFFAATVVVDQPLDGSPAELESSTAKKVKTETADTIMAVRESGSQVPPTYVLVRGMPGEHDREVQPRFPRMLGPRGAAPHITGGRAALAHWLASASHPLTARVMVNRLWQHHFGRGLVSTPNDFGRMGARPTHPALLDWLAIELVRCGWSIKHIQRLIVTSASYRQTSEARDDGQKLDLQNRFLWRMPAKRMDAETIRDAVLAVSGMLVDKRGGPGVRLTLSKEMSDLMYKGKWQPSSQAEQARRSIYRFIKRNLQPSFFTAFDAPDTLVSCPTRDFSTHAGQALTLLNSPLLEQQATIFAQRIMRDVGAVETTDGLARYIERAYRLTFCRKPSQSETQLGVAFLETQIAEVKRESVESVSTTVAVGQALRDYCLVILNLDEFVFY